MVWNITEHQHQELLKKPCAYCGGPLPETQIGLDRLDHRKGYEIWNVVPCCALCNRRKGGLEQAGFVYPRTVELMRELLPHTKENGDDWGFAGMQFPETLL